MADIDVRFYQLVIDCADPRSLAAFWMRFTGFEIGSAHDDWVSIRSPDDGTRIAFQRVPESKAGKNRLHVDFATKDEAATASAIEAIGATRRWASDDPEDPFIVLADPEGNEFCIVRDDG
ncbi:MAG: VOC family protein [Actinomycetota bacterium]